MQQALSAQITSLSQMLLRNVHQAQINMLGVAINLVIQLQRLVQQQPCILPTLIQSDMPPPTQPPPHICFYFSFNAKNPLILAWNTKFVHIP